MCFEKIGNKEKAKYYWRRVETIDPNNEMLKQRNQVWDTGNGEYVNKNDAVAGACCICAMLECIFDCC